MFHLKTPAKYKTSIYVLTEWNKQLKPKIQINAKNFRSQVRYNTQKMRWWPEQWSNFVPEKLPREKN